MCAISALPSVRFGSTLHFLPSKLGRPPHLPKIHTHNHRRIRFEGGRSLKIASILQQQPLPPPSFPTWKSPVLRHCGSSREILLSKKKKTWGEKINPLPPACLSISHITRGKEREGKEIPPRHTHPLQQVESELKSCH